MGKYNMPKQKTVDPTQDQSEQEEEIHEELVNSIERLQE